MTTAPLLVPESDMHLSSSLPVLLLFPGQGAQHERMAAGLYGQEPVFTAAIDEIFDLLGEGGSLARKDWLAPHPQVSVHDPARAQLLLFAVNYAMGRLVMDWAPPAALLGHSVGELAAATLAGVFTLPDAIIVVRGLLSRLADPPAGGMLAVAESSTVLQTYVDGTGISIGAINAPRQTILSGADAELAELRERLNADDIISRPVASKVPFHNPVMLESLSAAERDFARISMRAPTIPLYSTRTAGLLTEAEATDPALWARQPAMPVLFWPALEAALAEQPHLVVDAGPSGGLAALARQHPTARVGDSEVIAALPDRQRDFEEDLRRVRVAEQRIKANAKQTTTEDG